MIFWNSCFFHDPMDVGNLVSGSSAFSKNYLNIRNFTVHVLLKAGLENFEHHFTSMWDECNCVVVLAFFWHCLSLGLEWKLTFSSPVATAEFSEFTSILNAALPQHHLLGFEIAQLEFHHSPSLGSASQSNHARKSVAAVKREEGASDQHGFIGVLASTGQGSVELFKET